MRSVKQPLRIMLRQSTPTLIKLQTWLCKVETVVNLRPLSYTSEDSHELLPLSPENFLIPFQLDSKSENSNDLSSLLTRREDALRQFFSRWKVEFLKQKVVTGVENKVDRLKVGDVVLLDDDKKRTFWPLARVESLQPGRDGVVRSVMLKVHGKSIRRGIHRVYLLEPVGEC